jgi:hypothetical protein
MVLVIGQGVKLVIDQGFTSGREEMLDRSLAVLFAMVLSLGLLTWLRVYQVYWIGARFTADLRRRVYDHLVTLSPGFYEEARTGEVSSRVTNDVTLIEAVMGGTLLYSLRMALTMVGCLVMLFVTSVKLALITLACIPVALGPIAILGTRVRKLARVRIAWPTFRPVDGRCRFARCRRTGTSPVRHIRRARRAVFATPCNDQLLAFSSGGVRSPSRPWDSCCGSVRTTSSRGSLTLGSLAA